MEEGDHVGRDEGEDRAEASEDIEVLCSRRDEILTGVIVHQ